MYTKRAAHVPLWPAKRCTGCAPARSEHRRTPPWQDEEEEERARDGEGADLASAASLSLVNLARVPWYPGYNHDTQVVLEYPWDLLWTAQYGRQSQDGDCSG